MKYLYDPRAIEALSFSLIEKLLKEKGYEFPKKIKDIAKRIVHTGGYVSILDDFRFSSGIVENFEEMIKQGVALVTDTEMAKAGIGKNYIPSWKGRIRCYSQDPDVVKRARELGITRAMAACDKAVSIPENRIFVIGNSPTFLFRLLQHYDEGRIDNIFVIGVPVGFVGARESKEELMKRDIPYIVIQGERGGTTYAVAITNALFKLIEGK